MVEIQLAAAVRHRLREVGDFCCIVQLRQRRDLINFKAQLAQLADGKLGDKLVVISGDKRDFTLRQLLIINININDILAG